MEVEWPNAWRKGKSLPRAWFEDKFFFFSVLRCFMARAFRSPKNCHRLPSFSPSFSISPFFVKSLLLYILLLHSSWSSICWSCRSPLECLFHPAPSSACCKLQQTRWHCSGVIPSLMRPDCQLQAFNAEVTASPIIAPPPYPHSCPPVLVLLFGTTGRLSWKVCCFFLPWPRFAEDGTALGVASQQLWAFLIHPRMFFPPWPGLWAWY